MITPDDFTPVDLLTPPEPLLEQALGYDPPATHDPRWVAFFWEPAGDKARYADGKIEADANWPAYLAWLNFPANQEQLQTTCQKCGGLGQIRQYTATKLPKWTWAECKNCLGLGFTIADLGSSDRDSTHWLLLDRETRQTYIVPVAAARRFLSQQWDDIEPVGLDPEQFKEFHQRIAEAFNRVMASIPLVDMAEIEARMRQDRERLNQLINWLQKATSE